MTSPKVIVRTGFKLSLQNPDRGKIYNNRDINYVNGILDYYKEDKKRVLNMVDYFTGKINKHEDINLVLEDGSHANSKEVENRKKYINKQFKNSNVWQIVLSIDKKLVDHNTTWEDIEKKLAKEILPTFFKSMGFVDVKKMCYEFSLHTNTKHPHFHISFMERQPNTLSYKNEFIYRRTGKIPKKSINVLKRETVKVLEREGKFRPLATQINKDIEELKKYFDPNTKNFILYDRDNILLEEKILRLGMLLSDRNISYNNKIKFNSIKDKEIKDLTRKIKNDLFKDKKLLVPKNKFNNSINNMNNYFISLNKRNNISLKDVDNSYTKYKEEYLNNYILNAIVNHARYSYDKGSKRIISSDDVIQSIILNNYLENEKYSKKDIIKCSLSNNGINKYRQKQNIYNAIKNIDQELKYASEEYIRLMQQQPKEKIKWY